MVPSLPNRSDQAGPRHRYDKHGAGFAVRPFHPEDWDALVAFYDAFQPKRAAQGLPPDGVERITRWLRMVLASGHHLLALREGVLIGHALLAPTDHPDAAEYAIFLQEDERGRGVGTELSREAIELARRVGLRRLWLSVEPHNRAALRAYEKVGFRLLPGTIFSLEAEMELVL